ncbi:MAG: diacylglycerol kinase family lipid kinase [Clostridia bacterium]|nr:diacylglycerol kinase family lipid kinase [Clostridia bacterium]
MKHCFIVNPTAGRMNADMCRKSIESICADRKIEFELKFSQAEGDIDRLAEEAASNGFKYIYAIGGDGTLNEAANGIMKYIDASDLTENETPVMVPVPCGTGNDFVRTIDTSGVYKKYIDNINKKSKTSEEYQKELDKLICSAVDSVGNVKKIDVGTANGRYFINIASIGFDAEVVISAKNYKNKKFIPNSMAYYIGVFTTFLSLKPRYVKISYDSDEFVDKNITLVAIANGKYYGGGVMPAPDADLKDGKFDVCTVDFVRRYMVPIFFPKYNKGRHGSMKQVDFKKCRKVVIASEKPFAFNVDGEVSYETRGEFEICKNKIPMAIMK